MRETGPAKTVRTSALALVSLLLPLVAPLLGTAGCSSEADDAGSDAPAEADPGPAPALAVVAGVPPEPKPTAPLDPGATCVTAGCHARFATAPFVHGVVHADARCSVCHEKDRGGHVFPVKRGDPAGCTHCHADVASVARHPHGAAQVGCLACHDAHAADHAPLLRDTVEALCAACHPPDRPAVPHAPFATGGCVACHDPHGSDFPHLLRGGSGPEHCSLCHDDLRKRMAGAARVHAPALRDCLICHDAHGTDFPHALRAPVTAGCFGCHTDLERLVAGATAPHGALALEEGCASCHDPHASEHPSLLRADQTTVCLGCHDRPIEAGDGRTIPDMTASVRDRKFLHGPVESANCTACHNVHGGSQSRLLRATFTEAFYASFDIRNYALCFECHEADLVTTERTTALTSFRDGDRNLHYVHVNRQEKGRTCRTCHEMHGSDLPAHVAESVPFGTAGWALPIDFRPTATGGSCAPGCHPPMGYDRSAGSAPLPDSLPDSRPASGGDP